MQNVFRSFSAVLKDLNDADAANFQLVRAVWNRSAGPELAKHAVPAMLEKNRLTIAVKDETWRRNMADLSTQIIYKLNSLLAAPVVRFVEFKVDAAAVKASRRTSAKRTLPAKKLERLAGEIGTSLEPAAENIADGRLRSLFIKAAGYSLGRQQLKGSEK